jgi:hypothetical protein
MEASNAPHASPASNGSIPDRERLEILRFGPAEAQQQAIRALMDRGMLNFTSIREEEWVAQTSVARKLREVGVAFEWLTEHT